MKRQLRSENETTRVNAAAHVSELNPADHEALLVLMDQIKRRALFWDFATETLARAGASSRRGRSGVARRGAAWFEGEREAAHRALQQIGGETGGEEVSWNSRLVARAGNLASCYQRACWDIAALSSVACGRSSM